MQKLWEWTLRVSTFPEDYPHWTYREMEKFHDFITDFEVLSSKDTFCFRSWANFIKKYHGTKYWEQLGYKNYTMLYNWAEKNDIW